MPYRSWLSSNAYAPITYVRGVAVDLTTLLVAAHVGAMLVVSLLLAIWQVDPRGWMECSPEALQEGRFWSIPLHPFYHNIGESSIWFAIEMVIFYMTGREVERFIGRPLFAWYYALLVLLPPALLVPLGHWSGLRVSLAGSSLAHFAVFTGFVTVYPNLRFYFGLVARWLAWVLVGVVSLIYLVDRHWIGLGWLWSCLSVSWLFLKYVGVDGGLPVFEFWHSWRAQRSEQKIRRRVEQRRARETAGEQTVDAILEKISREGMDSLSPREREILDQASRELAARESGGPRGGL